MKSKNMEYKLLYPYHNQSSDILISSFTAEVSLVVETQR